MITKECDAVLEQIILEYCSMKISKCAFCKGKRCVKCLKRVHNETNDSEITKMYMDKEDTQHKITNQCDLFQNTVKVTLEY